MANENNKIKLLLLWDMVWNKDSESKKALQNVSSYKHYSRRKLDNDGVRAVLLQQSVLFKIARQV